MTAADVKRSLHRGVQYYAASQSTETWRGTEVEADWSQRNLSSVERLAEHVLELADDDPRFVALAEAYEGQDWRLREPLPWEPGLGAWLGQLGVSASNVPQDPDEFVSAWADVALRRAQENE
jgi:hypothetical protein